MHLVVLGTARRDHNHGHTEAILTDRLGHSPTVEAWQHQIDHGDVGTGVAQPTKATLTILCEVDIEAGMPKMHHHRFSEDGIVFDYEDTRHYLQARLPRQANGLQHGRGVVTKWCASVQPVETPRTSAYRAGMQILSALIILAVGVVVGWFGSRLLRRQHVTHAVAAARAEPDASWQVDIRAISDVIPMAFLTVDDRGRIVHINEIGTREFSMLAIGDDVARWAASLAEVVDRVVRGEELGALETIVLGDPPRSLRVTALRTPQGVAVMLADVTEEVDFEEARRTFSAAVSHELRTPLARILGLAETLALPDVEDERDELVMQIENEVDGMRRLIDEMLLLAALDRGRLAVADGIVDVCAITAQVVDSARQRRIGRGRQITFTAPAEIDVPVAARLYEVVVQNLLDNALIHGGSEASVDVTITATDDTALISVRDTGTGIAAQHLPYVFQRFYRGDAARSGPGSGLGLALVKHIVEAHGGTVTAESDGMTGSILRIQLPLAT